MKILLKNGTLVNPAGELQAAQNCDLLIDGEKIAALGPGLKNAADQVIELNGALICPGFIDLHVHLRSPGQEHKEDLASGLAAAAAGGFTTVFAMPNTEPALDSPLLIRELLARAEKIGGTRLIAVGAATMARAGKQLSPYSALRDAGALAVSDDGSPIADPALLRAALRSAAALDLPLFDHAETPEFGGCMNEGAVSARWGLPGKPAVGERIAVERDIALAEDCGARLHVCHLSTADALVAVRAAKARGRARITCEVAPHHFALTEAAAANLDANAKMNPPLRRESDRQALLHGISDGTVDAIATDHAPHAPAEKSSEFTSCPDGIIGLETAVALALEFLVHPGLIDWPRLVELFAAGPARIAGRPEWGRIAAQGSADLTIIDPAHAWTYDSATGHSKSRNTPFGGRTFTGRAVLTIARGRIVHDAMTG